MNYPTIPLTPQECDVLRIFAAGGTHKTASRQIGKSPDTLKGATARARLKLGARTTTQAVSAAIRLGLI